MAYETIQAKSRLKYSRKNMASRPQMMKKMRNSLEEKMTSQWSRKLAIGTIALRTS
jgi:hypothetical protein